MSEILFIASDPSILALVEDLRQIIESEICVESDYTAGIRKIFDARPAIVFLQHMIEKVACDKLANQVKMLLDGEAVALVLLSEESGMSYGVASTYDACFDLCLPLGELSLRVQQMLRTLPAVTWKESAQPGLQTPPPSRTTVEITVPAGDPDVSFPFFPWLENDNLEASPSPAFWDGSLEEEEGNTLLAEPPPSVPSGPARPQFLGPVQEERFAAKTTPLFFDDPLPQGKPAPERGTALNTAAGDLHRIERDDPNLVFGSMSGSHEHHAFPARKPQEQQPADQAATAALPLRTLSPLDKTQTTLFASEAAIPLAGTARQPARPKTAAPPAHSPGADELSDQVIVSLGIRNEHPWFRRGLVIGTVLVFGIALLTLFFTQRQSKREASPGIGELDAVLNRPEPPPPAPAAPHLASLLPQVAADPGYPGSHPGWERYQADALDYLAYREKGSLRAIQVVSAARGAITGSFLKLCIRSSSGSEQFIVKKTEERSGIRVTAGTLQNGGEILIYRQIPDGEIRGFVLSFPSAGHESAQKRKK